MNKIEEIASVHLGKAGDGSVVKPYVTPDTIDPSLLVAIPRVLNRTAYGIDKNTRMEGVDVWHAYEFSTMMENGYPISGTLKWAYDSRSTNIVESKSAKLYLNSYNMHRYERLSDKDMVAFNAENTFYADFYRMIGEPPSVALQLDTYKPEHNPFTTTFVRMEEVVNLPGLRFEAFNEDPNILSVVPGSRMPLALTSNALRSNCRVTNQPDWGDVFIYINGNKHVTAESMLQYIVSMRKENHFHEEIAECIYKRLLDLLEPDELLVSCLYTRRGGIDICPVRATSLELIGRIAAPLIDTSVRTAKTQRQ